MAIKTSSPRSSIAHVFPGFTVYQLSAVSVASFARQKVFARPSDQPKQDSTSDGRHIDNPPVIVFGAMLESEHAG
jgi:hypothetical protein